MFHDSDQGRFGTPRNSFDILNNHHFEEMLWENNTVVMRRRNNKAAQHGGDSFTPFFEYQDQSGNNVNNARAVPEDDVARTRNVFMSNKDNYVPSTTTTTNADPVMMSSTYVRSNKRSSPEEWNTNNHHTTIQNVENKKLKAINDFIAPQGDSLVPAVATVARKVIESGDRLVPGPGTSMAASNDAPPPWTMDTIYEESDDSEYPESQQWMDDEKDRERGRRTSMDNKRSRSSSLHSRSEKKRRDRINKKMRALQVLLPNCNKADKASVLDEAINYVKTLQFQLHILSTGSHMFPSPMMMPPLPPQIPMNQLFGLGFPMGPGFGHQFPMPGFRGFMPCFPYMPWRSEMAGPVVVPDVSGTTTTSIDQFGSYPKEFLQPREN